MDPMTGMRVNQYTEMHIYLFDPQYAAGFPGET